MSVGDVVKVIWQHPANQRSRIGALAKAVGWQVYKRTIRKPFTISAFGGKFRLHPDSHDAGRMIYFNTEIDPQEMAFLRRYLRPGDNVIDAGANVGIYTVFCAALIGDGRILAFEPDPTNGDRLRENITLNRLNNVTVRQSAISDYIGTADFTQGADSGNALYSLKTYDRPPQTVEITTLDKEIGADTYQLCKMDVEGAEWAAFKGTAESLARNNPPVWLVELSERITARAGGSVQGIEEWLKERGYSLWRYAPKDNELIPFVSGPRRLGYAGDGIAIADAKLDWVKTRLEEA